MQNATTAGILAGAGKAQARLLRRLPEETGFTLDPEGPLRISRKRKASSEE